MTIEKIKTSLHDIADQQTDSLRKEVAQEALEYGDIPAFFSDLRQFGCITGIVGKLIYYCDTHAFFDKYYNEIETLRVEFEESTGAPLAYPTDLKNHLAWFAFEETAYQLARELEIEV